MICPNCQAQNRPGANYCATCGRGLDKVNPASIEDSPTVPSGNAGLQSDPLQDMQTVQMQRRIDLLIGRRTDVGRLRDSNEDSLLILDFLLSDESNGRPAGLFVVADGMGGHEGGEIASGMLVRAIARQAAADWLPGVVSPGEILIDQELWLAGAIQAGNREIFEWAKDAGYEMGTTIVAALVFGERAFVAHVGDSRAYRINGTGIERLTIDHSLVESLVVSNQISRDEARAHPQSNVIYRTIGDRREVTVDRKEITLVAGESLLLCSDGLSGMLADEVIHQIVVDAPSPQVACDSLIDSANQAGGEDNITAIIISPVMRNRPAAG